MPHFVGLDVSQKMTTLCVVNEQGSRLWRGVCATDPEAISACILRHAGGVPDPGRNRPQHADRRGCDNPGSKTVAAVSKVSANFRIKGLPIYGATLDDSRAGRDHPCAELNAT